jgi:hypothetical protein
MHLKADSVLGSGASLVAANVADDKPIPRVAIATAVNVLMALLLPEESNKEGF